MSLFGEKPNPGFKRICDIAKGISPEQLAERKMTEKRWKLMFWKHAIKEFRREIAFVLVIVLFALVIVCINRIAYIWW